MWRPGTVGLADPPRTPQAPQTDESTLHAAGFDHDAVRRLCVLREAYAVIEYTDNQMSVDRLRFLRWRVRHGAYGEDT